MKATITRLLQGTAQAALFACLLSGVAAVAAAPVDVQVFHKTDGILVVFNFDNPVVQDVTDGRI